MLIVKLGARKDLILSNGTPSSLFWRAPMQMCFSSLIAVTPIKWQIFRWPLHSIGQKQKFPGLWLFQRALGLEKLPSRANGHSLGHISGKLRKRFRHGIRWILRISPAIFAHKEGFLVCLPIPLCAASLKKQRLLCHDSSGIVAHIIPQLSGTMMMLQYCEVSGQWAVGMMEDLSAPHPPSTYTNCKIRFFSLDMSVK
jgi:hypothetical protein